MAEHSPKALSKRSSPMSLSESLRQFKWKTSNIIRNYYFDKKLGIKTANSYDIKNEYGVHKDVKGYSSTLYSEAQRMVDYMKFGPDDVFIDLGCGKGRVVFMVATYPLKKVIGIELNSSLAQTAQDNLKCFKGGKTRLEISQGDVFKSDLREGTVFYMFNPFGPDTFQGVLNHIEESRKIHPRGIRIVYRNPVYREILDQAKWLEPQGNIPNTEIFVWKSK